MPSLLQTWALPMALLSIANISTTWFNVVAKEVPEPYLDEFFHIPQAQKYCIKDYSWDPKITTPPGLYLVSLILKPFLGCDASSLRGLNAGAICIACPLIYGILRLLHNPKSAQREGQGSREPTEKQRSSDDQTLILDAHSALNICLFPPLFFFSALYYTDVVSTLTVLLSYRAFLMRRNTGGSFLENFSAVFNGIVALFFRQTNVFWVAVFPAGLAVIDALKKDVSTHKPSARQDTKGILEQAWGEGLIHDVPVQTAGLLDYILFAISTTIAAIRKPMLVIAAVFPYVVVLTAFAGFVTWNGGVVLGDKAAHVATIHFPQMLYFWPFVVFFSASFAGSLLLRPFVTLLPNKLQGFLRDHITGKSNLNLPGVLSPIFMVIIGLVVVQYNTIIHPYTLADNRHYVFYIFKTFRLYPTVKYLAVPVYYTCAWLALGSLGSPSQDDEVEVKHKRQIQPTRSTIDRQPCHVSFITIWLVTTTLSVVSAPLVEPRYFIIPWVIWRIHVAYLPVGSSSTSSTGKVAYDLRLIFETFWFLLINATVGYNFLYRGFSWANEPGKIQRFLW